MNERIRELAEHAELPDPHVPGQWRFNNQQLEFFAELIIRECAEIADKAEPYKANDLILKHFGVDE